MQEHDKTRKNQYPELRPLWIGLFVDILGFYIIIPYLKQIQDTFQTTTFIIGLLIATNAIFSLFSAPLWGKLSDKYGRRPTLLAAEAGTCIAFIILAFSNNLGLFFIARIVDGIFGGNFPITRAIITDRVPPKDRGLQMTNIGVVHTLAGLVAPALGGFLSIFQIFGPSYPLAASGLVAASLSFSTILITYFFIKESWPKSLRDSTKKEIKIKINILKNKDATYLLTQYAFHSISFMMYVSTLSLFIGIILHLDTLGISVLLFISGISRAIVRFTVFKPTMRLLGEKKMTILGLSILTISLLLVGIFGAFYPVTWVFIILMVIVSYGVSCSRGLMVSKITQMVTHKERGKINGITTTIDSLSQIVGPIIGTFLIQELPTYWFGISMGLLAFIAFIMVFKKIVPLMQKEAYSQEIAESPNYK